jgi:hypothetical protein
MMAVYVDPSRHRLGRMIMCHMWASSLTELFAMADRIGVARKWLQRPQAVIGPNLPGMPASWMHFDISKSKRALAVKYGAIETDKYGPLEHVARRDGNTEALETITYLRTRPGAKVDLQVIDA